MFHSIWKVMPALALGFSSLAVDAANSYTSTSRERQESQVEDCEEKCCFACRKRERRKIYCCNEELPAPDPCRPCWYSSLRECVPCWGESVRADFLYWGAQNNGFSYALESSVANPFETSVRHVSEHWAPGFRIGLGHEFDYDWWDLNVTWTWYKNNSSETRTGVFYTLYPMFSGTDGVFDQMQARQRLSHNVLDAELGKEYWLSKAFSLRPFWGLRAAWLHQRFSVQGSIPDGTNTTNTSSAFIGKDNWFGFGPRVGICTDWLIGWGFSILGKASTSALYGRQKAAVETSVLAQGGTTPTVTRISNNVDQLTPSLQTFLGLQWGLCFNDGKAAFAISAGWETNHWWNEFHLPIVFSQVPGSVLPTIGNQPLEMQGLTLNVRFDF